MTTLRAKAPFERWFIDHAKVTHYLLNLSHKDGASKAKYLMAFGFSTGDPGALAMALAKHPTMNSPGREVVPLKGLMRVVFEGPMETPDGRLANMRTVWEETGPREIRLITAVPLTR